MPARVYECDESEVSALKKILSYDPYLDPNLIPKSKDYDPKELAAMTEDQRKEIAQKEAETSARIKTLREDKIANAIFARQECDLREGGMIGAEEKKSYLYVKAPDDFFEPAEARFKRDFKTVKRANSEIEKKFIVLKEEEESRANAGFGAIFG